MATATQSPTRFDPYRVFYKVGGRLQERMPVLSEIFNRVLQPLYGSQGKALGQIKRSEDRTCFLLYDGNNPVGVLQFKNAPTDEFAEFGVTNSIEIKSLFVNQSQSNSGRGLGSMLIGKLFEEVRKLPPHGGIHVTVSEDKQESLLFFQKKGFRIVHTWDGRYHKGKKEHLLFRGTDDGGDGASLPPRTEVVGKGDYPDEPELIHVIHNAHDDDIHAFLRLSDERFVTGSKDTTVVEWNGKTRDQVRIVAEAEPVLYREERWVTSLCSVNPSLYASAARNGSVDVWELESGKHVKSIRVKTPKQPHKSLKANAARINCITASPNGYIPGVLAGMPTQFNEVDIITSRTKSTTPVHANDWVFSIRQVDPQTLLCVIGCTIHSYRYEEAKGVWNHHSEVFDEPDPIYIPQEGGKKKKQRAFIQSMEPVPGNSAQFVLARLHGHVEVIDSERKQVIRDWSEHKGRVWHALSLGEHTLASSCEDKTIRIWDTRQAQSVHKINSPIGPVNAMMRWDDTTLIAATSPEKKRADSYGAQIRFYDIRC